MLGPALILGALAIFGLVAASKKQGASGAPGGGFDSKAPALGKASSSATVKAAKLIPVDVPAALLELEANALTLLTVDDNGFIAGPVTADAVQKATTIAAQLEAAGFPEAAKSLRFYIALAADKVAPLPPDKLPPPIPGVPKDIQDAINKAIHLERDPNKIRALIAELQKLPPSSERDNDIDMLSVLADQLDAALRTAADLKKAQDIANSKSPGIPQIEPPVSPPPVSLPPTASPPIFPSTPPTTSVPPVVISVPPPGGGGGILVPKSKDALLADQVATHLNRLLLNAGGDPKLVKGKEDKSLVMRWQASQGTKQDGKMGPGSTAALGQFVGNLPLVLYWPTGATQNNVFTYRNTLRDMADQAELAGDQARADGLRTAATKERGQAGIVGSMPA